MFVMLLRGLRSLQPTFDRRVGLVLLATLIMAITPLGWHLYKPAWLVLTLLAAMVDVVPHKQKVIDPVPLRGQRIRPPLPPRPRPLPPVPAK
jgi:hypothetical protein